MDTVFCPICGKEYKDVKMHIRKGHDREPEEVVEEAFGQKLTLEERQRGTLQERRMVETMRRVNKRSEELRQIQKNRLNEMQALWRDRQKTYRKVMNERIKNITNK